MEELSQDQRVAFGRLRALLELLPSELDRQLAPSGLSSFEFSLLEALSEADLTRLRLSALASRTNATLPRLSRVVTGLERKGLVSRMPCEEDGRAINAVLTDAGARAYGANRALYENAVSELILRGLDADGIANLASVSLSMLMTVDPERRMAVTGEQCAADPRPVTASAAP